MNEGILAYERDDGGPRIDIARPLRLGSCGSPTHFERKTP